MELKIEEHFRIVGDDVADDLRARGGEELRTDLEHTRDAVKLFHEVEGFRGCFDVECDYQFFIFHIFLTTDYTDFFTLLPTAASKLGKPSRSRIFERSSQICCATRGPW